MMNKQKQYRNEGERESTVNYKSSAKSHAVMGYRFDLRKMFENGE